MPLDRVIKKYDTLTDIDNLISWIEKHPEDREYYYRSYDSCLMAQYLRAYWARVSVGTIDHLEDHFSRVACVEPHTFGAALERAKLFKQHGKIVYLEEVAWI